MHNKNIIGDGDMSYCCKSDDIIDDMHCAKLEIDRLHSDLNVLKIDFELHKEWENEYLQKWKLAEKQLTRQSKLLKEYEEEIDRLNCELLAAAKG